MALSQIEAEWLEGFFEAFAENKRASAWAKGFVADQHEKWEKYGSEAFYSTKVWNILKREAKSMGYNPDQPDPDEG